MPQLRRRANSCLILIIVALFFLIAALIVLLTSYARAAELPAGATCEQIKSLVAEHGKVKALAWAIRNGYSWAEIREAKKCLKQ